MIDILKANPHRWGPGKIHAVTEDGRWTRCGKVVTEVPGEQAKATRDDLTCKVCVRSLESEDRQEQYRAGWEQQAREREKENRRWWAAYNRYLDSPRWKSKRQLVLKRAHGMCEGCGLTRATQVHHLTYARVGSEMLFDLVAVCDSCHERLHEYRRDVA